MINPVVSAEWLHENFNDPDLIILDASPKNNVSGLKTDFPGIQIKGARIFDLKNNFSDKNSDLPNMLPLPNDFSFECQKLGINNNSKIVVYDNLGIYTSPRVWWMFKTMGHDNISVLNGGLPAWKNKGYSCEPINMTTYKQGDFLASYNPEFVKNAQDILTNIDSCEAIVIDARSEGRFNATAPEPRADSKSGHIPNSKNLPFKNVLKNGKFLPKNELSEIFKDLNLNEKPLIFTCGSGLTACIILLALELISENPKSVYDGSWTEWGQQKNSFPIE